MKTRIISGAVMAAVVALVLFFGLEVSSIVLVVFVAAIAALGVYELVANAAKVQNIALKVLPSIYTAIMVFVFSDLNYFILRFVRSSYDELIEIEIDAFLLSIVISVFYAIIMGILILVFQKEIDLVKLPMLIGMPIIYAYAFSTIASIIIVSGGIYYLLLALNFACICDMGAYFVGVSLGKTKLCPEISPKKTVEGAIGGIVSSIIASLVIVLCYAKYNQILITLLLTIPLCVVGMAGDLFASVIKRRAGIKDYGNLIPGHGGILDRVDSLLFISPVLFSLILLGVL